MVTHMATITDKAMQGKPSDTDRWLTQPFKRGAGVFLARITPAAERLFYFRYTDTKGRRPFLPIGHYHPKGNNGGLTLAAAYKKASDLSSKYQSGVHDLKEHFAAEEAEKIAAEAARKQEAIDKQIASDLERERRITVRTLFKRWADVELKPHLGADGKRVGRKDAGEYTRAQFERRVFASLGDASRGDVSLGDVEARLVKKSDLLTILDEAKAKGQLRTANMLLADLKQMFQFALARELIERNPLDTVTKAKVGGKDVERERVLTTDEIQILAKKLPKANLTQRSSIGLWLILGTGCRISELMNAEWINVDFTASTWHLPVTKNQRPHTIHLSAFSKKLFEQLQTMRVAETKAGEELSEWVFPNARANGPVCIKSFGKQLHDRQRPPEKEKWERRAKNTDALSLPGGRWTAHDLRRTAATMMAQLSVSTDVIDECLNHKIANQVSRVYIRDRRLPEQAKAFDLLGNKLSTLLPSPDC